MSGRPSKVSTAPMAVASDGALLVNAYQLTATGDDLATVVEAAKKSGLVVFVGIAVPQHLRGRVLRDLDDGLADIVGRLGPRLIAGNESAFSPSSAARASSSRGRRGRRPPRPRGRPRGP
jgi:hypothetical protein